MTVCSLAEPIGESWPLYGKRLAPQYPSMCFTASGLAIPLSCFLHFQSSTQKCDLQSVTNMLFLPLMFLLAVPIFPSSMHTQLSMPFLASSISWQTSSAGLKQSARRKLRVPYSSFKAWASHPRTLRTYLTLSREVCRRSFGGLLNV